MDEIKRKLEIKKASEIQNEEVVEKHIDAVTQQMKQLHSEIADLLPLIERLTDDQKEDLSKKLSVEGSALMKCLLSLTS